MTTTEDELDQQTEAVYRDELLRRLYGHPTPNDVAGIISFRDAEDRAERLSAPDEALELLRCAQASGDEALARAIALRADTLAPLSDAWGGVIYEWAAGELARIGATREFGRGW